MKLFLFQNSSENLSIFLFHYFQNTHHSLGCQNVDRKFQMAFSFLKSFLPKAKRFNDFLSGIEFLHLLLQNITQTVKVVGENCARRNGQKPKGQKPTFSLKI